MSKPNIRLLSKELQLQASSEIHETEEAIEDNLKLIREWLESQPHLTARTDDQFLIAFLRGCKYNLEKVKTKVDNFYTIKQQLTEICGHFNIQGRLLELFRTGVFIPLSMQSNGKQPSIFLSNCQKIDFNIHTLNEGLQLHYLWLIWIMCHDDNSIMNGCVEIIDLEKFNIRTVLILTPTLLRKIFQFVKKAVPIRVKCVHVINAPKEIYSLMITAKKLMSEEYKNRFHIHQNVNDLYTFVDKTHLPMEYGGKNRSIPESITHYEKLLMLFNDSFMEEYKYGVNETLRSSKNDKTSKCWGLEMLICKALAIFRSLY